MNRKDAIELARKLRKRQTQSESISWSLIIEIDGAYHIKQTAYDKEREEILIAYGYQIIRFNNEIIENNPSKFLLDLELFINRLNSTS